MQYATGWTRDCGRFWVVSGGGFSNPGSPDLFDARSTNCAIDVPSNKWNNTLNERTGLNRYVGFLGGYVTSTSGVTGPFYGETVRGSLTEALTSTSCQYEISFWAVAPKGSKTNCGVITNNTHISQYNKVEIVLRKNNDCNSGLVVWTSSTVNNWYWGQVVGQFSLTPLQAAVGYNQIEFRMTPKPTEDAETALAIHGLHIDDVCLIKKMNPVGHSSDFTLIATNPSGSPTNYLVTATVSSIPPESGYYWEVCEVNLTTEQQISGTCMVNPSNWWHSSLALSNTFPGYCCNNAPITGNGIFLQGHKYRVTRGTWGPCHPWSSTVKYVYMSTSGMIHVTEDMQIVRSDRFGLEKLSVYPSPASDRISLNWTGSTIQSVRVHSISGELMLEQGPLITGSSIPIDALRSGLYILSVVTKEGTASARFVVSH